MKASKRLILLTVVLTGISSFSFAQEERRSSESQFQNLVLKARQDMSDQRERVYEQVEQGQSLQPQAIEVQNSVQLIDLESRYGSRESLQSQQVLLEQIDHNMDAEIRDISNTKTY